MERIDEYHMSFNRAKDPLVINSVMCFFFEV